MFDQTDLRFCREHAWIIFNNRQAVPADWHRTEKLPHFPFPAFTRAPQFLQRKGFRFYVEQRFKKACACLTHAHNDTLNLKLHLGNGLLYFGKERKPSCGQSGPKGTPQIARPR